MDDNAIDQQHVREMYQQLGGNLFTIMTGAIITTVIKAKVQHSRYNSMVSLKICLPIEDVFISKNIHYVWMHLMGNDTYTFEFFKQGETTACKIVNDVYCDEAQDVFELNTGLLITPYNRVNSQVVVGVNV